MEEAPIPVRSLREAMNTAAPGSGSGSGDGLPGIRSRVVVECVEVDQAAALVSLLHARRGHLVPVNLKPLKRVAIVDRLVTIVGSAIIPIVVDSPFDKGACEELRRYAFRVKDCGRIVGGSFHPQANRLADRLLNHVNQIQKVPRVELASLVRNAKEVREIIVQFRRSSFTLSPDFDFDDDTFDDSDWHGPNAPPPRFLDAPQKEAPTIYVTSLRNATEAAIGTAGDSRPRNIIVTSVHLRHCDALQELLAHQGLRRGWSVVNIVLLKLLSIADQILLTIAGAILPYLCDNPTDEVCCNSLCLYADKLRDNSEGVRGPFSMEATSLADRLFSHVYDVSLHPLVTQAWLGDNARQLIEQIMIFRSRQVTLSEEP